MIFRAAAILMAVSCVFAADPFLNDSGSHGWRRIEAAPQLSGVAGGREGLVGWTAAGLWSRSSDGYTWTSPLAVGGPGGLVPVVGGAMAGNQPLIRTLDGNLYQAGGAIVARGVTRVVGGLAGGLVAVEEGSGCRLLNGSGAGGGSPGAGQLVGVWREGAIASSGMVLPAGPAVGVDQAASSGSWPGAVASAPTGWRSGSGAVSWALRNGRWVVGAGVPGSEAVAVSSSGDEAGPIRDVLLLRTPAGVDLAGSDARGALVKLDQAPTGAVAVAGLGRDASGRLRAVVVSAEGLVGWRER